jgi:hypothetical protein
MQDAIPIYKGHFEAGREREQVRPRSLERTAAKI